MAHVRYRISMDRGRYSGRRGTARVGSGVRTACSNAGGSTALLDQLQGYRRQLSFPPTHPLSWRRFRVGLRCHPHGLGVEYDIGICIVLYCLLLLET